MLSQQDAKNLIDRILSYSKLPECEIRLSSDESVFIRFANNGITTSGYVITQDVLISSTTQDRRSGSATVNEFSDEALKSGVAEAERLAAITSPNPESVPALSQQQYPELPNYDAFTGSARGDVMIPHVKAIIDGARKNQLISAGFIQRSATAMAIGNKAGLFGYHTFTDSSLSTTMRNAGGTSSGWASQSSVSLKDIQGEVCGRISVDKCVRGARTRRKLEPGKYTVILEPSGVSDLVDYLGFGFSARQSEQGQSFLSKQGGGTRLGEAMFPAHITLRTDPFNPTLAAIPWSGGGLANEKMTWIESGVVKNLSYDRFWASKAGKPATPGGERPSVRGTGEFAGGPDPVSGQRVVDYAALVYPHAAAKNAAIDRADTRWRVSGGKRASDRSGDEFPLE